MSTLAVLSLACLAIAAGIGTALICRLIGHQSEESPTARRAALARVSLARAQSRTPLVSETERRRLVELFRKEHASLVDPPLLGPEVHANLMVNTTPAVARKWLEDERLLDEHVFAGDRGRFPLTPTKSLDLRPGLRRKVYSLGRDQLESEQELARRRAPAGGEAA